MKRLQKDETAKVYNNTPSGKPIFEGEAVLIEHIESDGPLELWRVEFLDERGEFFDRWIDRRSQ